MQFNGSVSELFDGRAAQIRRLCQRTLPTRKRSAPDTDHQGFWDRNHPGQHPGHNL